MNFLTLVKIRGRVGEMTQSVFRARPRTQPLKYISTGRRSAVWEIRVCMTKNSKSSAVKETIFRLSVVVWRNGSALVSINEVNLRRIRLVLGWVTVSGFSSRCRIFISVCNQPPRPTQPCRPFVGRRNEYQPKGGDA